MAGCPALLQRRVHGQARHTTDPRIAANSRFGRGSLADTLIGNHRAESPHLTGHDHRVLRNEATTYNTLDLGVGKSIRNLPQLRRVMSGINDRYLAIQQDVLETYIDRGDLARLRQPTITASGRRTPGLTLDDPRLLAVMQAPTCFV